MAIDDDAKAQMEATRQMVGSALQEMGRVMVEFQKKAKDASGEGGGLKAFDSIIKGITQSLAGPIGLGAAVVAVGKSLDNFAVSTQQLHNLSKDIGTSVPQINAMSIALDKAGISAEAAAKNIARMGDLVQNAAQLGMRSEVATVLRETMRGKGPEGMQEIQRFIELSRTDKDKARLMLRDILNRGPDDLKSYRDKRLDLDESALEALKGTEAEMGHAHEPDEAAAKKLHTKWVDIKTMFYNDMSHYMDEFAKIITTDNSVEYFKKYTGLDKLKKKGDDKGFIEGMNDKYPWMKNLDQFLGLLPKASANSEELIRVEQDSNKTLRDIYTTLSGEGGGGGSGGGYGIGIRTPGGSMQGGLGGFRGLTSRGRGGGFRPGHGGAGEPGPSIGNLEGLKGNEFLAKQRASRIDEINKDPQLKENVLKMLQLEEGSVSGKTGAFEALLNRSIMTDNSVKSELFSGFYGPINRGGLNKPLSDAARKTSQAAFDNGASGSDLIQSRTDQGMVGDPNASGPGRIRVPGTTGIFNFWKGRRRGKSFSHSDSAAWAAEQERQISSGGDAQMARDQVDKSASFNQRFDANMNATVDFKNAPSWVKTSVETNNRFKKVKVSRDTPVLGKASSANGDQQPWSFE